MHDDDFKKGRRGEFRGDFTRDSFDPSRHYSSVLMQQGRMLTDADWNEQNSISQYYFRKMIVDTMGPHFAPAPFDKIKPSDASIKRDFEIIVVDNNKKTLRISPGHYYVNGILCENNGKINEEGVLEGVLYREQPYYPLGNTKESKLKTGSYLVYLDVWERHISYVEDDYIREKALGGADTSSRSKIVWQVKVHDLGQFSLNGNSELDFKNKYVKFLSLLFLKDNLDNPPRLGKLKARAKQSEKNNTPCITSPKAKYRGTENQLYRGEIQSAGKANVATFKWSRENGAVIFPILENNDNKLLLEHLGRDERSGLKENDWVEVLDDSCNLVNECNSLLQIESIDSENMEVTLKGTININASESKHPYLRRWDQKTKEATGEGLSVVPKSTDEKWIPLEDGIEVKFNLETDVFYQKGDYWLIPARVATGDVEWPGTTETPEACLPHGVEHHYAPLTIFGYQLKAGHSVIS